MFPANAFNDADATDTLTYTATKADGTALPTWLSFTATTRTFSGTPTAAETVSVKVTASDGTASVSDTFDIMVSAAASAAATLSALTVSPKDIIGFTADRTSYEVGVASTVTQATIVATKSDSAATVEYSPTDADGTAADHQVDLSAGRNSVTVTVTAEDTTTTQTYTLSINRGVTDDFGWKASDDFDGLITAQNNSPRGMWSDETTMWVTDWVDDKLYAYDLATKARDASKDFNTLTAAGNQSPYDIWSDNTTMWVTDYQDDKVYAYNLATKARDASKDFDTLQYASGIWSDGTTMWVANQLGNEKLYAYDLTTKARDASKDFNTLDAAGNSYPGGIWSNNITMWVTDEDDAKLYAYNMATKARDAGKDFNTLTTAGNGFVYGIWANTNTMWASDSTDDKIYSYNMPAIAANTPAAGAPAITAPNVFRVPAVLGVDLTGITDTDGTVGIATNATYKWQRFDSTGATLDTDNIGMGPTYTLTDTDATKTLKVVVNFTDNASNSEGPLTSAATLAITAAASCAAPTYVGGATQIWTGKLGVKSYGTFYGFHHEEEASSLDNPTFTTESSNDYEILILNNLAANSSLGIQTDPALSTTDKRTLVLHICDQGPYEFRLSPLTGDNHTFVNTGQNWSMHAERTIYLSQDTAAPTFTSATVNGSTLVVTLSEDLGTAGSLVNSAFTVKKGTSGTTQTLSGTPSISGSTVTLTLATAVTASDTAVKVAYTKPTSGSANKLIDKFGNETATFPDQAVTNNTTVNNPPTVANAIPDQSATVGTAFSYTFPANTFNDTNATDTLTYTAKKADDSALPTWLAFDPTTRTFSGTPTAAETVSVKVTASDGTASVSDEFDIVVRAADNTAPTVTSIERQDPTALLTNSDTPTWRVTFSEAVKNVDGTDFTIAGTTATPTVTPVTLVMGGYDVTPTGGDIASLTGTITLAFASAQNIADTADNTLTATTPTGTNDPTFELENTIPTFVSGTANGVLIVLTFSEALDPDSLPPGSTFYISTNTSVTVNNVSIEGTMVTLTVTPAILVDQTVDVNNNAYAGAGTVPLKDFAGNQVQPAVQTGSYRVTNETPIGPPASLTAEEGDGRVRLVWTNPAGISQFIEHQFRYAAGTAVPVGTVWTRTGSAEAHTALVSGLVNGTAHAFEVRAVRSSEVGAAATVSATPLAGVCTLDLGNRREVWSATLTVGRDIDSQTGSTIAGYRNGRHGSLSQNDYSFMIGGASYTINGIATRVGGDGGRRKITLTPANTGRFTPAVKGALRFHWCSNSSGLDNPTGPGYQVTNPNNADWSLYNTRELALSLPANNDATGQPVITGSALVGQTLTATTGNVADADGLPPNASDFAWQWIRVVDTISTPIQDATSSTYALTQDDVDSKIKVLVSFTDSLSGVESRTSDAHPSRGTVMMGGVVTQREDWRYTFKTSDFDYAISSGTLASVTITEMPARGALTVIGWPINNGPFTISSTGNRGHFLEYKPLRDEHGQAYATFKFKVNENTAEHTMTINITPVNDPAYGRVTITGPEQVGYYLTADTTSIGDQDGVPSTLNYQWKRYAADGTTFEQNIGANSSAYRVTDNDVGKKIKLEVRFTDNDGTREVRLSDAFPYIASQTIGEVTLATTIRALGRTANTVTTGTLQQAFTTGKHTDGYTITKIAIISEDPEGDDIELKVCEVDDEDALKNATCVTFTEPDSSAKGMLFFTAPGAGFAVPGGTRNTYKVVISSPGEQEVRVAATKSDGHSPNSVAGWSIRDRSRREHRSDPPRIRMALLGSIN